MPDKQLFVPLIAELQNFDSEEIISKLQDVGAEVSIDSVNWKEQFPYSLLLWQTLLTTENIFM